MRMGEIIFGNTRDSELVHKNDHPDYAYCGYDLVPESETELCTLGRYELPPGKSAYPYHCHMRNEEVFYILSGRGLLRTPAGERVVGPGESVFFPAGEAGAHKITNTSETEPLVYLDFDVCHSFDVCLYPDSGKIGIYGSSLRQIYEMKDRVDYDQGE